MKKAFLLFAIAGFAMTSCKKDYTCTCKVDILGTTETYTYQMNDVKKKDAKTTCDNLGSAWIALGGTCDFE